MTLRVSKHVGVAICNFYNYCSRHLCTFVGGIKNNLQNYFVSDGLNHSTIGSCTLVFLKETYNCCLAMNLSFDLLLLFFQLKERDA